MLSSATTRPRCQRPAPCGHRRAREGQPENTRAARRAPPPFPTTGPRGPAPPRSLPRRGPLGSPDPLWQGRSGQGAPLRPGGLRTPSLLTHLRRPNALHAHTCRGRGNNCTSAPAAAPGSRAGHAPLPPGHAPPPQTTPQPLPGKKWGAVGGWWSWSSFSACVARLPTGSSPRVRGGRGEGSGVVSLLGVGPFWAALSGGGGTNSAQYRRAARGAGAERCGWAARGCVVRPYVEGAVPGRGAARGGVLHSPSVFKNKTMRFSAARLDNPHSWDARRLCIFISMTRAWVCSQKAASPFVYLISALQELL